MSGAAQIDYDALAAKYGGSAAAAAAPNYDAIASKYGGTASGAPSDSGQTPLLKKYGLPPTADLSKSFFDPANKGVHDPQAFTNAYQEFHANDPQSSSLWDEVKSWVGHALAPYEGAMAPRSTEEALSGAEMVGGDAALAAGAGVVGDVLSKGVGNTIAQAAREPFTGKLKAPLRTPIPLVPRIAQPNVPEWIIPKGDEGTITNPITVLKSDVDKLKPGTYYRTTTVKQIPSGGSAVMSAKNPATGPVLQVPEPRPLAPGEKPGSMYSIPRDQLFNLALRGKPGAADVLRDLGVPQIVIPNEAGYPGPRPD